MSTTGFRELDRKLGRLARAGRPDVERAALYHGGEVFAREARRLVPVDEGDLRDSIDVRDEKGVVVVGPIGSVEGGAVEYADEIEFGWSEVEAQPYMRPAVITKQGEALRAIAAALRDEIR